MRVKKLVNYPINSISIGDIDLVVCSTPTNAMVRYILVPLFVLTPFLSEVINFPTLEMSVAMKTTLSTPESLKKIFFASGNLMEYNERGKPLKRLSSLTNPKSAGLKSRKIIRSKNLQSARPHPPNFPVPVPYQKYKLDQTFSRSLPKV